MPDLPSQKPFVQPGEPLADFLRSFWQRQIDTAELETPDFRHPPLPLARIKKVMKSDPDVKMIAADAPVLFCKACEIFIAEITSRAFIIADSNKRRTLSRSDIAKALAKSDQFDFLIDIVPREETGTSAGGSAPGQSSGGVNNISGPAAAAAAAATAVGRPKREQDHDNISSTQSTHNPYSHIPSMPPPHSHHQSISVSHQHQLSDTRTIDLDFDSSGETQGLDERDDIIGGIDMQQMYHHPTHSQHPHAQHVQHHPQQIQHQHHDRSRQPHMSSLS